jgi:hypothetical protein
MIGVETNGIKQRSLDETHLAVVQPDAWTTKVLFAHTALSKTVDHAYCVQSVLRTDWNRGRMLS